MNEKMVRFHIFASNKISKQENAKGFQQCCGKDCAWAFLVQKSIDRRRQLTGILSLQYFDPKCWLTLFDSLYCLWWILLAKRRVIKTTMPDISVVLDLWSVCVCKGFDSVLVLLSNSRFSILAWVQFCGGLILTLIGCHAFVRFVA